MTISDPSMIFMWENLQNSRVILIFLTVCTNKMAISAMFSKLCLFDLKLCHPNALNYYRKSIQFLLNGM